MPINIYETFVENSPLKDLGPYRIVTTGEIKQSSIIKSEIFIEPNDSQEIISQITVD
jgi:hypothetical protein